MEKFATLIFLLTYLLTYISQIANRNNTAVCRAVIQNADADPFFLLLVSRGSDWPTRHFATVERIRRTYSAKSRRPVYREYLHQVVCAYAAKPKTTFHENHCDCIPALHCRGQLSLLPSVGWLNEF